VRKQESFGKSRLGREGLTNSLPSTGPSSSTGGLDAVLCEVRPVSVRRTRVEVRLDVVVWALIFVVNKKADGRSQGDAVFRSGLDVDEVVLVSLHAARQGTGWEGMS
jgi:hypothetical protein